MNGQMIVWCVIVGVLLCTFLIREVSRRHAEFHQAGRRHFVEIGKEKEMFYIPGDPADNDDFDD